MSESALARERGFWDEAAPSVDEVLARFRAGPESPAATMIAALGPLPGRRVLDFACGAGITSLWLAAGGAEVVGVDLSPGSIEVARAAASSAGLTAEFRVVDGRDDDFGGPYDGIVGHFALHHVDVRATGTRLAEILKPGGVAAFVETTADNPILNRARKSLPGRFGIVRLGTPDEHPLTHADRDTLREIFGELDVITPWFQFVWLVDRHVLRFRYPRTVSPLINRIDRRLARIGPLSDWGYTKVFVARKSGAPRPV